ncbi:MAG: sugar ABC transporter permease [Pseudonocardiales bacterium]
MTVTAVRTEGGARTDVVERPPKSGRWTPYLFLAPYMVLFTVFILLPVLLGIWISLHAWDFTLPGKPWIGLDNYKDLFSSSSSTGSNFWHSMKATGIFTLFSVPLLVVIPLFVAMLMNAKYPGRNFFRAIYFAPYVLGVAVIGVLWRYILDNNIGLLNHYLGALGLPGGTAWLTSVPAAWVALVGVTVWWTLGFNAVIYLAGLQDIPRELYEAASIDGASAWQKFRYVTMPGLAQVRQLVVVTTIISSANMFGQSYIITQGAPGTDTKTAIYYIAQTGLRQFDMGKAAAMSFILTVSLLLLSGAVALAFRERKA